MNRIRDALERWRAAERALLAAEPGSAEADRARTVLDHAKAMYQRLMDDDVEGHQLPPGRPHDRDRGPDSG